MTIFDETEFLSIADVAARWRVTVEDVLHQADLGKLVLSVSLIGRDTQIRRHREDGYNGTLMPEIPMVFDVRIWTARSIARTGRAVADELSCRDGKVTVEVCDNLHLKVDDLLVTSKEIGRIEAGFSSTNDGFATTANVLDPSQASSDQGRQTLEQTITGVDRNKILAAFPPPIGVTPKNWGKRLGEPSNKMKVARVFSGGNGGISALWNPAKFAMYCAEAQYMTKQNLTVIIRREFAEWLPEWEKYTASFN